jgi:hypothetical protein
MYRAFVKIALVVVALSGRHVAAQDIIHVDAVADQAPSDGSNWHHAYLRLDDALAVAGQDSIIRIAAGTYRPDTTGLVDPRDATFALPSGVVLEGGYAGASATDPETRDTAAYETRLSGDIGVPTDKTDNCYHVLRADGVDDGTVIDGLTIIAGNADGAGGPNQGGGILINGGSPTVRDCTLRENSAQYGGGIFNNGGTATLERVLFDGNEATASGGALYNYAVLGASGVSVLDCDFVNNVAFSNGGAVRNWDSAATFHACTFTSNHVRYGGAAVANGGQGAPVFVRCIFENNRTDTLFALHNCYGGAMHNTDDTQPVLRSCLFEGNRAISNLPGLSYGGAIANSGNAQPTAVNCTLVNNSANIGNGFYNEGQSLSVANSSILWNGGDEIVNNGAGAANVTYSIVTGSWPGTGNLADDPLLADQRPQPGSPCINAGDPNFSSSTESDLDGHARVLCGRVDVGAFEFGWGDYNCDQLVNLDDFVHWPGCMTGPDFGPYPLSCAAFDYGFDGDVDLNDFAEFSVLLGDFPAP